MDEQTAKAKAQSTYNAASDHYDHVGFWEKYGQRTVERLNLRPGFTVLDVGCGMGASALPAAQRVAPNGHVIGADLAEKLLDIGRMKAANQRINNVEFRVGDMEKLGFPDDHFDTIISVFSIFFVPDMPKLVRELWRMVKPGGQLAITTWGPDFLMPVYGRWLEGLQSLGPELYSGFRPWYRLTTPQAVRQLLFDGGISEAEVVAESGIQPLRTAEDWWTLLMGSGDRWTIEQLGPEVAAQIREDNVQWTAENAIRSVETNVIYAVAYKG